MTWTRLSDDFADRPELLEVSRSARLLHIEALIYGNRQGTDGRIPTAALPRLSDSQGIAAEVQELIEAGVWSRLHSGAVQVVGWTERERQESASDVRARQQYNADKQAAYRRRKAACAAGDHTTCDPRHCKTRRQSSAVTGNETRNEASHSTGHVTGLVTDSPPSPTPPRPKEGGRGGGMDPDIAPDCFECGQPAATCRARSRTSGHAYTPRPDDAEGTPARRVPLIAAPDVVLRDEAVS
jgi:hypothetical protein